jgi:hypothetical protein
LGETWHRDFAFILSISRLSQQRLDMIYVDRATAPPCKVPAVPQSRQIRLVTSRPRLVSYLIIDTARNRIGLRKKRKEIQLNTHSAITQPGKQ